MRKGTTSRTASSWGARSSRMPADPRHAHDRCRTLFHVHDTCRADEHPEISQAVRTIHHVFPQCCAKPAYHVGTALGTQRRGAVFGEASASCREPLLRGISDHLKVPAADFRSIGKYPIAQRTSASKFSSNLFIDSFFHPVSFAV